MLQFAQGLLGKLVLAALVLMLLALMIDLSDLL